VGSKASSRSIEFRRLDGGSTFNFPITNCCGCTAQNGYWQTATRIMCFDETAGALVRVEYPTAQRQAEPEISRIECSAFRSVSGRLIPFEIRAINDRTVASVRVLEITTDTDRSPARFQGLETRSFGQNVMTYAMQNWRTGFIQSIRLPHARTTSASG